MMQRFWRNEWEDAVAARDEPRLRQLVEARCPRCDGDGEVQVGCAMIRPIMWKCEVCHGHGFRPAEARP